MTRRCRGLFRPSDAFFRLQFSADYTITMFGFDFRQGHAAVLEEFRDYLPMTVRQVFYRLVGKYAYPKDENGYERLADYLNRARRARLIPWESIRDDSLRIEEPEGFSSQGAFCKLS